MPNSNANGDTPSRVPGWVKTLLVVLSPFLILGFIVVLAAVGTRAYNNHQLSNLSANFSRLVHPKGSQLIATRAEIGQWGNGNHCDLFVAELRSGGGNHRAILNHYDRQRISVPNDKNTMEGRDGKQSVQVEFLPSPLPQNYKATWYYTDGWDFSRLGGKKNLYVVLLVNTGDNYGANSICDGRCGY